VVFSSVLSRVMVTSSIYPSDSAPRQRAGHGLHHASDILHLWTDGD
jgi:hypothetical protein